VRIQVDACKTSGARTLDAKIPSIRYDFKPGTTDLGEPGAGSAGTVDRAWTGADRHLAVVRIPVEVPEGIADVGADLCCVALDIPSAGQHDEAATLLYDVDLPIVQTAKTMAVGTGQPPPAPRAVSQATTAADTYEAHGTMLGFVIAAAFAATAVAMQLALFQSVAARSKLTDGPKCAANVLLAAAAGLAAIYIVLTIVRRVAEVETAEPADDEDNEAPDVPSIPVGDAPAGLKLTPVQPAVVISRYGIVVEPSTPHRTFLAPEPGAEELAPTDLPPVPLYLVSPRSSLPPAPASRRAARTETMF